MFAASDIVTATASPSLNKRLVSSKFQPFASWQDFLCSSTMFCSGTSMIFEENTVAMVTP